MSSITTSLDPMHRGQITGLAKFTSFLGLAIGALAFRHMMPHFGVALVRFASFKLGIGFVALYAFRAETPAARTPS